MNEANENQYYSAPDQKWALPANDPGRSDWLTESIN